MLTINPNHRKRRGVRHFAGELRDGTLVVEQGATLRDADTLELCREPKAKLAVRVGERLLVQAVEKEPWDEVAALVVVGKNGSELAVKLNRGRCRDGAVWVQKMEKSNG